MTLEQQVTNLEISKKLKELGVKQESLFSYYTATLRGKSRVRVLIGEETDVLADAGDEIQYEPICSTFTVAELGEVLPVYYESHRGHGEQGGPYYCTNRVLALSQKGDTEANARGKMLIYLIEKGLWSPKGEKSV